MQILSKYLFLLVVVLLLHFLGITQVNFYKIYTNNGYDFGEGVVQLEDSSYVITGSSSSFTNGASQAFLLKIDSLGKYIWSANYGGQESDGGRRVLYKKNVGFYIAGYTNSIGNGGFDAYLIKTNENGVFQWEKSYGGAGWEKINDAVLLKDTSILMVGQSNSSTAGNNDFYLLKTDKNGDTIWTKKHGTLGEDFATCVKKLNDTICIVGGQKYIEDSLKCKSYLMAIHVNGTILWEKFYGNDGEYVINDLSIIGNEINVVGCRKNKVLNDLDGYCAKVSINGNFIYEFAYSYAGKESYECISNYGTSSKFYIAYNQYDNGFSFPVGKDLFLGRFASDLNYDNHTLGISNIGDDIPNQIISTNDGGVLLVGYNSTNGSGGNNVFVTKVGKGDVFPVTTGTPTPNSLVALKEIETVKEILIFPNPTNSILKVQFSEIFSGEIQIIDNSGRLIYSENLTHFKGDGVEIDCEKIEKGNYLLKLVNDDHSVFTINGIIIN